MIVDELIVVLGLDVRKFTEGQRDALAAFKKTEQGAREFGQRVEGSANKMSEALGTVQKGVVGILAGIAGGGVVAFVERIVQMDAATGRWAKTIGTSVPNLSTWQYMLKQVGGSAEEATTALSAMQDQINNVRAGSGMFDDKTAFLLTKIGGLGGRNADQVLRDLQKYFAGEIGAGRMTADTAATQLRWLPGMNQGVINLMLSDFERIEKAARKSAVADEASAAAAEKAQAKSAGLIQGLERWGLNIIDFLGKKPGEVTKDDFRKLNPFGGGATEPGTTRGDRNNNPGNIKDGPFARSHGATGADSGGFAIFPDRATGAAAQGSLVRGSSYQGLTLDQFAQKYAEGNAAWRNTVGGALGIGGSDIVNNQDPRLIDAIRRAEGTGGRGAAGTRGGINNSRSSTSSTSVSIGQVVLPGVTDAEGFANGLTDTMKRWGITSPANSSLV